MLHNHVSYFACESICPALQLSAHHNAATNTCSKRDNDCIHRTFGSAGFPFSVRSHGGIILNMHTDAEP
jgi:hypothetical protein